MTDLLLLLGIWVVWWTVVCGLVAAAVAWLRWSVRWLLAAPARPDASELDDWTVPDRGWGPW